MLWELKEGVKWRVFKSYTELLPSSSLFLFAVLRWSKRTQTLAWNRQTQARFFFLIMPKPCFKHGVAFLHIGGLQLEDFESTLTVSVLQHLEHLWCGLKLEVGMEVEVKENALYNYYCSFSHAVLHAQIRIMDCLLWLMTFHSHKTSLSVALTWKLSKSWKWGTKFLISISH